MNDELLELGLIGLANTSARYPGSWFMGHKGAAVLAAHFLCHSIPLDEDVLDAVTEFAQAIIREDEPLFTPAPAHPCTYPNGITPVVTKVEEVITQLTADGHDIIFASLALKALIARPDLATEPVVAGLVQLLNDAQRDDPRRYLGYDDYLNMPVDYSTVPEFESPHAAAMYALTLHNTVYPDQVIDGHAYFLAGNKLHDVTHAHALVELDNLGYHEIASSGIDALRKQFHLCATSRIPEGLAPFKAPYPLNPWQLAFWERDKTDAHQVKLAYSVMSLLASAEPAEREAILAPISTYWHLLP